MDNEKREKVERKRRLNGKKKKREREKKNETKRLSSLAWCGAPFCIDHLLIIFVLP